MIRLGVVAAIGNLPASAHSGIDKFFCISGEKNRFV